MLFFSLSTRAIAALLCPISAVTEKRFTNFVLPSVNPFLNQVGAIVGIVSSNTFSLTHRCHVVNIIKI